MIVNELDSKYCVFCDDFDSDMGGGNCRVC